MHNDEQLVAGFDPQRLARLLGDHDLVFGGQLGFHTLYILAKSKAALINGNRAKPRPHWRIPAAHVAAYIEELQGQLAAPTVKQHLACLRMLRLARDRADRPLEPRALGAGAAPLGEQGIDAGNFLRRGNRAAKGHERVERGRAARSRHHRRG